MSFTDHEILESVVDCQTPAHIETDLNIRRELEKVKETETKTSYVEGLDSYADALKELHRKTKIVEDCYKIQGMSKPEDIIRYFNENGYQSYEDLEASLDGIDESVKAEVLAFFDIFN